MFTTHWRIIMFQLLKKYRKGVSPVIAIVLLIALTVAAAAVIWTLTSGILDDASGNTLVVSGSASATVDADRDVITVTVTLRANSETTLTGSASSIKTHANSSAAGTVTVAASPTSLSSGDTSVTLTLTSTAQGDFGAGAYVVNLSWTGAGDDPKLLEISFNLS